MRASTKIILALFILSFLAIGVSGIGYIYFGMSAEMSNLFLYGADILFAIAILWSAITIIGFKRMCKWIYFVIVIFITTIFVTGGAIYGIGTYIIMLVISIALLASLVPMVFKSNS